MTNAIQTLLLDKELSPQQLSALTALATQKIPDEMILSHPGKGAQTFRYVSHVHATQVMQDSGLLYDYHADVGKAQYFDQDHSAAVPCTLTVRLYIKDDDVWVDKSITEVGVFEDQAKTMPRAAVIAAAASRGLPRCMFRMFGFGKELYKESATPPIGWWAALTRFSRRMGVTDDDLAKRLKDEGFTGEELSNRYEEAIEIVKEMSSQKKGSVPLGD